jgi:hypothetical protein
MVRLLLVILAGLVLPACSPAPRATAPELLSERRPADFTLAASVYAPPRARPADLPRSLRAGRFVVETDGWLRHGAGPRALPYPARTRQLSPHQMDQLWRLVRESGLLDPEHPAVVDDPGSIAAGHDRGLAVIYIAFAGERRTLRVLLDRTSEGAIEAERITDRLADLAWVQ